MIFILLCLISNQTLTPGDPEVPCNPCGPMGPGGPGVPGVPCNQNIPDQHTEHSTHDIVFHFKIETYVLLKLVYFKFGFIPFPISSF